MKNGYRILLALILAILVATSILLVLSPDTVPVHYNLAGEINRMGSKYEYLIFPALAIPVGGFFGWMAKRYRHTPADEKALVISGICVLSVMGFLGIYFQTAAILYDPMAVGGLQLNVMRLTVMAIGVTLMILGNFMPKARRNSFYGLRTGWSLYSDEVWQKSQRFAGHTSVLCGVIMVLLAAFLDGFPCLIMSTVLVLLWLIVCITMSYKYYRESKK